MENITEAPIEVNEMAIDTGDFDLFSSLDDLTVETKAISQENPQNDDVALDDLDDATEEEQEFEDGESSFDFEDIDDEDYDENGHEIEKEEDDADEESDDAESEEGEEPLEEEEEVEYDGYMVSLPDGTEVNLAEAVQGYRDSQAIEAARQEFENAKKGFQEEAKDVMKYMELAKLESDRVISDYKDFDWGALAKEDPQAYVENKEFLERYTQRRKEIGNAMDELKGNEAARQKEEFQAKAQSCVATLKTAIPGWNERVYQDLISYAVENGTPENDILECVDPTVFKMLHKAQQYDKGKQIVKAKVKRTVKSPKRVMKSSPKAVIKPINNKQKLEKLIDSGETSSMDLFAALED